MIGRCLLAQKQTFLLLKHVILTDLYYFGNVLLSVAVNWTGPLSVAALLSYAEMIYCENLQSAMATSYQFPFGTEEMKHRYLPEKCGNVEQYVKNWSAKSFVKSYYFEKLVKQSRWIS